MKILGAVVVVAALIGCSGRGALVPGAPRAGGAGGVGGVVGAGGTAGAATPVGLCPSRTGRRPDQLALLGQDGGDILLVHDDGTTQRVPGPGSRNVVIHRNGWIAAYDSSSIKTWKAQLLDVTGRVRAQASGQSPPGPPGTQTGIGRVSLLPDGTATFDLSYSDDDLVLSPDGRARVRPYFTAAPDAAGWVSTNLSHPPGVLGVPVMLNVETGEIWNLSLLAPGDWSAPAASGARWFYLAELDGGTVLVDESPDRVRRVSLPGFALKDLEVEVAQVSGGGQAVYVALYDATRRGLPLWVYDLSTGALTSALPDGFLPVGAIVAGNYDGNVDVSINSASQSGPRLWTVELVTGAILDFRSGLTVRRTRPAPGGPAQWRLLVDGAKEIYRYDRASGTAQDLHIAGDLTTSERRALVARDGHPLAVVSIDDGQVLPIAGSESLPAASMWQPAGQWVVGFAALPGVPWAPGLPLWRVDLVTGEARSFPAPDASLTPLQGGSAPLFSGYALPLLADGRVGALLYDGLGAGLFVGEPGAAWRPVGRRVRQVTRLWWTARPALAIAAEKDCSCYGPLALAWPSPPAGAEDLLTGTSLQFVAPDGSDIFPPGAGEHLGAFADESSSCALVTTDAHEWVVYDTQARTRRSLGSVEALSWATDAR